MFNCFCPTFYPVWYTVRKGPVLSRFDRFLLIGPRAKGNPALRLLTNQTYTFHRSFLCIVLARGPVFFMLFWETKTSIKFLRRSLKVQYKLALQSPS